MVAACKTITFLLLSFCVQALIAQDQLVFTKHRKTNNILVGTKLGLELPLYAGLILTSDYEYESPDAKSVKYFGISPKLTMKNGWGRGIGLGVGLDFTTGGYFRTNILLDLDFLFAYDIEMNAKGTRFKPSMFTKFELQKLHSYKKDIEIKEYYLCVNIIKLQAGKIAFLEMGTSFGLFRKTNVPYFADKGLYYKISYFLK